MTRHSAHPFPVSHSNTAATPISAKNSRTASKARHARILGHVHPSLIAMLNDFFASASKIPDAPLVKPEKATALESRSTSKPSAQAVRSGK